MKAIFLFLALVSLRLGASVVSLGSASIPANLLVGSSPATITAPVIYGGAGGTGNPAWSGKLVLMDRTPGGVTFTQKIIAALGAGAVGCVIADSGPSPAGGFVGQLLPIGTMTPLPVLMVTQGDGATIKAAAGATISVGVNFVGPQLAAPALPDPTNHAGEFLVSDGTKYVSSKLVAVGSVSSGTFSPGAALTLLAAADDAPSIAYQWSKDGAPLTGATNRLLVFSSLAAADAGGYTCTTSNASGSVTSTVFALTVAP